jgi:hypothetical protein
VTIRPPTFRLCAAGLVALVVAVAPLASAAPATGWQVLSNRDGLLVERRADDRPYEIRATVETSLPPAAIFETIWKQREHPQFVPHLKRLDLLSEDGDEHLAYEQVEVPLARDRDYTVRLHKRVDVEAQRYEIGFATANEAGPPPNAGHIRVPSIHGRWLIEVGPDGKGSRVRYEVFSDPGGAIPGWLLKSLQGNAVAKLVRAMLQRTSEKTARK